MLNFEENLVTSFSAKGGQSSNFAPLYLRNGGIVGGRVVPRWNHLVKLSIGLVRGHEIVLTVIGLRYRPRPIAAPDTKLTIIRWDACAGLVARVSSSA